MNYLFSFLIHEIIWLCLETCYLNYLIFKILLIISFLFTMMILILGKQRKMETYKYIICLGHKLKNNRMDIDLFNRLNKTIQYTKEDTIIILTGGITKGNSVSEAKVMEEYLLKNNITNKILLEEDSKTTIENIENIVKKYPYLKEEKILFISNDYHLFRIKLICRKRGFKYIQTIGVASLPMNFVKQIVVEKYCLLTNKR